MLSHHFYDHRWTWTDLLGAFRGQTAVSCLLTLVAQALLCHQPASAQNFDVSQSVDDLPQDIGGRFSSDQTIILDSDRSGGASYITGVNTAGAPRPWLLDELAGKRKGRRLESEMPGESDQLKKSRLRGRVHIDRCTDGFNEHGTGSDELGFVDFARTDIDLDRTAKTDGNAYAVVVYEGTYPGGGSPHNFAYHPRDAWIDLLITPKGKPIVLFLESYETVNWHVHLSPDVQIGAVYLMSYYPSTITGVNCRSTKIFCSFYEHTGGSSVPMEEWVWNGEEYSHKSRLRKFIQSEFHEQLGSYQYEYKGCSFKI